MRSVNDTRLRGSSSARTRATSRECPLCERGAEFHLHCQVCRAPLESHPGSKKVCPGHCRRVLSNERRKARSVRCWIIPEDAPNKKFRRWLPKKFATPTDIAMSKPSGARRAMSPKEPPRRLKRLGNV